MSGKDISAAIPGISSAKQFSFFVQILKPQWMFHVETKQLVGNELMPVLLYHLWCGFSWRLEERRGKQASCIRRKWLCLTHLLALALCQRH